MKVITAENVGKKFSLSFGRRKIKDLIFRLGDKSEMDKTFWALKNVSFDIWEGETFGIIGKNGSGKSTLFKIISRILDPDEGAITMRGKVFPMIELNAGFHEDLSGRENIYINGTILGMSKGMVEERIDEIIEFSELGEFIDVPVRYYSSGMYLRLGFSISILVDFDILLIDEILAVGDTRFQKKCLDKISNFRKNGKTIVYVSHDLLSIESLCDRAMWLDAGRVMDTGAPANIIRDYTGFLEKMGT